MSKRLWISALALLAVLVSTGIVQAQGGSRGRSNFDWIVARDITVTDDVVVNDTFTVAGDSLLADVDASGDLTVGGILTTTGAIQVDGGVNANASLSVDAFVSITPRSVITLTMNGWLTPTGSLQPIAAAGAVSIDGGTRIADLATGDVLILVNVGAQTITFTETTGLISAGNIALAAGDSATLVLRGTTWYQIAASNN